MLHHADSASDKLSIRRAKLRTYFQRQTLPPFEVKSINPQTSLKKWILVSIKADLSHSEKLPKQTYNQFYSQTYINNVREIHSTDIHGQKTKTLWPNKRFYMYFHQTFSLDPLWFFFHSRIGSGHVIIWKMAADKYKPPSTTKNNNHKTQTHNESTNMLMCNLCLMHVLHIHFHYQELILPGYNSTPWCELLLGCTNATSRPLSRSAFPLSFSAEHRDLKWRQRIHAE